MKKNWSYVAAMMLIAASGVGLTGCIDNDEPKGIYEIRVATANLLEAKKAAAAADAAVSQAQAEVAKLEIELKKAELEIAKIKAEAEAKAAALKAEAEAAKTQAEADSIKAEAEAIILKAQAEAKAIGQKSDTMAALAQTKIDAANFHLNKLKEEWEAQKIHNAAADNDILYRMLKNAYEAYIGQLEEVNNANYQVAEANKAYQQLISNLVYENGKFQSPNATKLSILDKEVHDLTMDVNKYQSSVDMYTEALDKINSSELNDLLAEYKEKYAENLEAVAEAKANWDAVYLNNQAAFEKKKELKQKYNDSNTEPIAIPAYTYEPSETLKTLGISEYEVVGRNQEYSLGSQWNYNNSVSNYNYLIDELKGYLLDTNDKAWTQARVNELTTEIAAAEKNLAPAMALWEAAVKVYNNGQKPDATALPDNDDVKKAIDAYNAKAESVQALFDAYAKAQAAADAADDAYEAAQDTYNGTPEAEGTGVVAKAEKAWQQAQATCQTAVDKAQADLETATDVATKTYDSKKAAANSAITNAWNEVQIAQQALARAEEQLRDYQTGYPNQDPSKPEQGNAETLKVLKAKVTEATTAVTAAQTKANTVVAEQNKAIADAYEAYTKAIREAQTAYDTAIATALKAQDVAEATYNAAIKTETLDEAYKPVKEAYDKWQTAKAAAQAAKEAFTDQQDIVDPLVDDINDAIDAQQTAINYYWNLQGMTDLQNALSDFFACVQDANGEFEVDEFPTAEAPVMYQNNLGQYVNAKAFLVAKSNAVFGTLTDVDGGDQLSEILPDEAFLAVPTLDEINAYIAAKLGLEPDEVAVNNYNDYPVYFGPYGEILKLQNRKTIAEAYLANQDLVKQAIAEPTANLEALKKSLTDAQEAQLDLEDEMNAQIKICDDLEDEAEQKWALLDHVRKDLETVIRTIEDGLDAVAKNQNVTGNQYVMVQNPDTGEWEQVLTSVKLTKDEIEAFLKKAEGNLDGAKNALAKAQAMLDDYNAGKVFDVAVETKKAELEYWTTQLNIEQQQLDFLKARVDELQARYDKATGTTTEGGEGAE